ncbi:MAG: hypothetical protein PHX60_10440 [Giesbergeria sp.]|uniref:hypothetical protein n=1 Tax=Giesbergeria sp. TaxID=2818473 RepID=UPI002636B2BC|nr:hypothetical protein [Giesbergeria sp.]MDD2610095.1 hypothetical protein [Giesbergeria sp.]
MTENTQNPADLQAQAEKIRADVMAALLRAAKAAQPAPTTPPSTNSAPADQPAAGSAQ